MSAYHPRTNGKCKHLKDILQSMLRKYVDGTVGAITAKTALGACHSRPSSHHQIFVILLDIRPSSTWRHRSYTHQGPRTIVREPAKLGQDYAAAIQRMKVMVPKNEAQWDKVIEYHSLKWGGALSCLPINTAMD